MNLVFLFSVILKGLGAVLEVLLQITITGFLGVSGYGTYSTWINLADLLFWVAFSGMVKCNTFYLSGRKTTIRNFKKRYYLRYVMPVLGLALPLCFLLGRNALLMIVPVITALEVLVMDRSSTLLSRGRSSTSLIGEYVLGRLTLVAGTAILGWLGLLELRSLLMLYDLQYGLVLGFFLLRQGRSTKYADISDEVSVKKWGAYQRSDLMHAMIEQMPVVMQYYFSGAFSAGVVSVVLLVKKLIGFIAGPTAKIFLPEFSRLYKEGDREKIRQVYGSIIRIQMLIIGPLAVVLLGFPRVILGILAEKLVEYDWLFMICSAIFLVVTAMGPCGGFLQMTGNEKIENRFRCGTLVLMAAVMLLTSGNSYFVLWGLCVQIAAEVIVKYAYICRWLKKAPVTLAAYLGWWVVPTLAIGLTHVLKVGNSFWMMLLIAGAVFAFFGCRELKQLSVFRKK